MLGYYNNPEATAAAIDADGWLHTGDLAVRLPNGYYKITGRLKDMVIRGGENIYPREIEEFLFTHPAVEQAAVVGVPDPKYGEELCAWIKLKAGQTATADEIREFCKRSSPTTKCRGTSNSSRPSRRPSPARFRSSRSATDEGGAGAGGAEDGVGRLAASRFLWPIEAVVVRCLARIVHDHTVRQSVAQFFHALRRDVGFPDAQCPQLLHLLEMLDDAVGERGLFQAEDVQVRQTDQVRNSGISHLCAYNSTASRL